MFQRRTVIVVGAGCSHEYGMPLGDGLKDQIVQLMSWVNARTTSGSGDIQIIGTTLRSDDAFTRSVANCAGLGTTTQRFQTAQTMSSGLEYASSIDRYLDIHRDNETMVRLGKMAIGRLVLRAENSSSLMPQRNGKLDVDEIRKKANGPNWLHELFLRMQEGVRKDRFRDALQNLTFVTFNYDRAIEHYLFHAIMAVADLSADETAEIMRGLHIYHAYGSLARLPWQEGSGFAVPFGGVADDHQTIDLVARNLKIFTETIEENDDLRSMRAAIQQAEQIIFLGFSFLDQNMELLRPASKSECTQVYATTYGESRYNVDGAKAAINRLSVGSAALGGHPSARIQTENLKAGEFMAQAGNLLKL